MAYDKIFRERTIEYRKSGHTLEETQKVFKVSVSTIRQWEKQLKETGHLNKKELKRSHKKIDPDRLREYIAQNPDAYLSEIATHFNCSDVAVLKALRRLKITRKKRQ
jgi:transposase